MNFIKEIPAMRWKEGKYEEVMEKTVQDENIVFHIDELPPRKFSTYPDDLDDFAVGYCLGDGLVKSVDDIERIEIDGKNVVVKTKLSHKAHVEIESESDILGYQSVMSDSAGGWRSELKNIQPIDSDLTVKASDIIENMKRLTAKASIWQETGSVHVAQLVYKDQFITREDVSRHVAVDKVIGAAAKAGFDLSHSYVCYSGRMPADMLIKIVRVGIPILVSNAAPAGSGYEIAKKGNITMVGFVRDNRFNLYNAYERIELDK